jgi:tRNA-dihydrouridine synthase B
MKIGKYDLDRPIILAPMAGVTDRPFRQLCKELGASLAVSEMVGANSFLHGSEKTQRRANHDGETKPISVQIVGSDPKMLAETARINEANGAEIIDINMGCPAKKICNTFAGSALLQDEPLVGKILDAVVGAVDIPVTLKIRTGWDEKNKNGVKIGKIAQSAGIKALSVHGRTRACRFKGHAEYDTIKKIKSELDIPVIANGDIKTPLDAKKVLEYTGVDGIMVGRAAQGNPWIFKEINHYLDTGEILEKPSTTEIKNTLLNHLSNLYEFYGERTGVLVARKHVSWYSKGQRNGGEFRNNFNRIHSSKEQLKLVKDFFEQNTEELEVS